MFSLIQLLGKHSEGQNKHDFRPNLIYTYQFVTNGESILYYSELEILSSPKRRGTTEILGKLLNLESRESYFLLAE